MYTPNVVEAQIKIIYRINKMYIWVKRCTSPPWYSSMEGSYFLSIDRKVLGSIGFSWDGKIVEL